MPNAISLTPIVNRASARPHPFRLDSTRPLFYSVGHARDASQGSRFNAARLPQVGGRRESAGFQPPPAVRWEAPDRILSPSALRPASRSAGQG